MQNIIKLIIVAIIIFVVAAAVDFSGSDLFNKTKEVVEPYKEYIFDEVENTVTITTRIGDSTVIVKELLDWELVIESSDTWSIDSL